MTILTAHNTLIDFANDRVLMENKWHTRLLVLNIMRRVATHLQLDLSDTETADELYFICCDLEEWPEDHGFGSSDSYSYMQAALRKFGDVVTCGNCNRSWDMSRDPCPAALCHFCHGRGSSDFEVKS